MRGRRKQKHKQPAFGAYVEELKKKARLGGDPDAAMRQQPVWLVGSVDWDGPFGWSALTDPEDIRELWARLRDYESMSWTKIEEGGSHNVALDKLSNNARRRLEELRQDDVDELFSLKIAGKPRAWGFREANVFRFLWWDPHHEVCPSTLKHT